MGVPLAHLFEEDGAEARVRSLGALKPVGAAHFVWSSADLFLCLLNHPTLSGPTVNWY